MFATPPHSSCSLSLRATSFRLPSPHTKSSRTLLPRHSKRKKTNKFVFFLLLCRGAGSDRRPFALQANALPPIACSPFGTRFGNFLLRKNQIKSLNAFYPTEQRSVARALINLVYTVCRGAGSDRRPFALQANALPTELPRHIFYIL